MFHGKYRWLGSCTIAEVRPTVTRERAEMWRGEKRDTDPNTTSTSFDGGCCEISDVKRKIMYIFKNIFIEIKTHYIQIPVFW